MPIITRLAQGKKNPNRVNLSLDGQFAFSLSLDEVAKHKLKTGLELSNLQIAELKELDQSEYVYAKLLNFISFRPRSVKEVSDRLFRYGVKGSAEQDIFITRLKSHGYLDDLAFAKWFIQSRNTHKLRSPRMLQHELQAKGIDSEVLSEVRRDIQDEATTISHLLTKKFGEKRTLEAAERQKVTTYLSRLGFAWDKIKRVVKSWESE